MNTTSPLLEQQALVVFSGGQDSATCLAWALSRFKRVFTLGFDYGQRHSVELTCRKQVREVFAQLKQDGTLSALSQKWIGADISR